jgi:hypothetical protein
LISSNSMPRARRSALAFAQNEQGSVE